MDERELRLANGYDTAVSILTELDEGEVGTD